MSSKILLKFLGGCLAITFAVMLDIQDLRAQVVSAPDTNTPSGQIIAPFDTRDGRETYLQVTNTNPVDAVNIHVQVLTGDDCVDNDFFDTLTAGDTVIYDLGDLQFNPPAPSSANEDDMNTQPDPLGAETDNEMGVVVITPTLGGGPDSDQAISFNWLHGVVHIDNDLDQAPVDKVNDEIETNVLYTFNAAGRNAVLTDGSIAAQGVDVDGVGALFELINPSEFNIHYTNDFDQNSHPAQFADIFFVAIVDDYGQDGASYAPEAGSFTTSRTDTFDADEQFRSCNRDLTFTCKSNIGINSDYPTSRALFGDGLDTDDSSEEILDQCNAELVADAEDQVAPVVHPDDCNVICSENFAQHEDGWTRLRNITSSADAYFGILGLSTSDQGGADYIFVK